MQCLCSLSGRQLRQLSLSPTTTFPSPIITNHRTRPDPSPYQPSPNAIERIWRPSPTPTGSLQNNPNTEYSQKTEAETQWPHGALVAQPQPASNPGRHPTSLHLPRNSRFLLSPPHCRDLCPGTSSNSRPSRSSNLDTSIGFRAYSVLRGCHRPSQRASGRFHPHDRPSSSPRRRNENSSFSRRARAGTSPAARHCLHSRRWASRTSRCYHQRPESLPRHARPNLKFQRHRVLRVRRVQRLPQRCR